MTEKEAKEFLERFSLDRIGYATGKEVDIERFNYFTNVLKTAIAALEEIQQYHSIGTVSECREAVEKQRAKEIVISKKKKGEIMQGDYVHYICPNCEHEIGSAFYYPPNEYMRERKFCEECGQLIDWNGA